MITGAVYVDLWDVDPDSHDNSHFDRQRLAVLERCPDGATVRVNVGDRWLVFPDSATFLHAHSTRLSLVIEGKDPVIVQRWVDAARIGLAWGEAS